MIVPLLVAMVANPAEAGLLDELGRRALLEGRYEDAVSLFSAVADIADTPQVHFNLGLAADLAEKPALAYASFTRSLELVDEAEAASESIPERDEVQARLEHLERRLGLVDVRSDPPGATVWVEGTPSSILEVTPATLVLPPGTWHLRLRAPGHDDLRVPVKAVRGERAQVEVTLSAAHGALRLALEPPEAEARLTRPGAPPVALGSADASQRVPSGSYVLSVRAPGHASYEAPLVIPTDGVVHRSVQLPPLPAPQVRLLVRCRGVCEGLTVFVDDQRKAPPPVVLPTSVGRHRVSLRRAGRERWSREVRLKAGRNLLLDVRLDEGTERLR